MNAPRAAVVWDPRFRDYDFGPGHPFSEASRELGVRLLAASLDPGERDPFEWISEVSSGDGLLAQFHEAGYVDRVRQADRARGTGPLDRGDTPSFPGCYAAAARFVAGADRAMRFTIRNDAPSFHPGGGFHHARPAGASGFCIFNDLAVAIAGALHDRRRVAYVDIDAHHGDGVMYGFYDSGRVLDIDFHQDGRTLFPGTGFPREAGRGDGAGLKVNVPLPPGAGDEALLPLFGRIVPPMMEEFRPDVIVLQHGVDGHIGDPLARLEYTPKAYRSVLRTLLEIAAQRCGGRLVVTGGGGYRPEAVARVFANAGRLVGGLTAKPPDASVPERWRSDFAEQFGRPAPATWGEPERGVAHGRRTVEEEALVSELEHAIGRRFPDPCGPVAGNRGPSRTH